MNLHAWPHRAAAKLRALFRRDMLEQEMHAEMLSISPARRND